MPLWTDVLAAFPYWDAAFLEMFQHRADSTANLRRNFIRREILVDIFFSQIFLIEI
jgi:hypothetical protein